MNTAEKTLAEKVADAWDEFLGEGFASDLSNRDLKELSDLLWASQIVIQNEWVRRRMMEERPT